MFGILSITLFCGSSYADACFITESQIQKWQDIHGSKFQVLSRRTGDSYIIDVEIPGTIEELNFHKVSLFVGEPKDPQLFAPLATYIDDGKLMVGYSGKMSTTTPHYLSFEYGEACGIAVLKEVVL